MKGARPAGESYLINWNDYRDFKIANPDVKPLGWIMGEKLDYQLIFSPEAGKRILEALGVDENMTKLNELLAQVDRIAKTQIGQPAMIDLPKGLQIKVNYNIDGKFAIQLMREDTWPSDIELDTVLRCYPYNLSKRDPAVVKQFERVEKNRRRQKFLQVWFDSYPEEIAPEKFPGF